jgi:hypothetical protein
VLASTEFHCVVGVSYLTFAFDDVLKAPTPREDEEALEDGYCEGLSAVDKNDTVSGLSWDC